jgi:hypothetical protein
MYMHMYTQFIYPDAKAVFSTPSSKDSDSSYLLIAVYSREGVSHTQFPTVQL